MVKLVLKRIFTRGQISFELPNDIASREAIRHELTKCRDKHNDFVLVTLEQPKKPRTTGWGSQNHHLNGHITQICNQTTLEYYVVKYCIKMRAVELLDYPYEIADGHIVPKPEHECSTEECAKLIEATHIWAAEHDIVLREE